MHNTTAKRRVCFVRHAYYPEDVRDRKEAQALFQEGFDVDVVCLRHKGQPARENVDGVDVHRIHMAHRRSTVLSYILLYGISFLWLGTSLVLLHLRKRFHCIHVATMPDFLVFTTLIPKLLGCKVLLDLHEPTPELWVTKFGNRLKTLLYLQTKIEQWAIAYADATVTVTDELRDRVVERGACQDRISVVQNVCDESTLIKLPTKPLDATGSGFRLITHGLIEERYGHIEIIKAVNSLRDKIPGLQLEILGAGEFRPQLEELTEELKCGDLVTFPGFVPREELFQRLHDADVAVLAMRSSPYSELIDTNKMYEYMALEMPLIVSKLNPVARQFSDDCVMFFEPGNAEDLARCILELFHHPEWLPQRAEAAYQRYQTLQWKYSREIYVNVVRSLTTPSLNGNSEAPAKRFLQYMRFVLRSKGGVVKTLRRLGMLIARFDISGKKMRAVVAGLDALGAKYNFRPAVIVPAVVLQRDKTLLQYAQNSHLEFGIHGYTHKNHRPWSLVKQKLEVAKAKAVFERLGMPFRGFRAPYLSCNSDTDTALESEGLLWNSDQGVMWPYGREELPEPDYHEAIEFLYHPADAEKTLAIPRMHGEMACIPLVLPDDEILVDRLGIKDENRIAAIWAGVFEQTHSRGDVFVLQLHPERFPFCQKGMDTLLGGIVKSEKRVWVAAMCEIAEWWKERNGFSFDIKEQPEDQFEIRCDCSTRATVVGRNIPGASEPFHGDYCRMSEKHITLATNGRKPCVGISDQCPPALSDFIKELGFACEVAEKDIGYSVFFDKDETYTPEDEVRILKQIEQSDKPLVRLWLWPDGYESAFATSHDLDCMTITDFVYRALGH